MACYNKVKKDWPARSDTPVSLFADPKLPPPQKKRDFRTLAQPVYTKAPMAMAFFPIRRATAQFIGDHHRLRDLPPRICIK